MNPYYFVSKPCRTKSLNTPQCFFLVSLNTPVFFFLQSTIPLCVFSLLNMNMLSPSCWLALMLIWRWVVALLRLIAIITHYSYVLVVIVSWSLRLKKWDIVQPNTIVTNDSNDQYKTVTYVLGCVNLYFQLIKILKLLGQMSWSGFEPQYLYLSGGFIHRFFICNQSL